MVFDKKKSDKQRQEKLKEWLLNYKKEKGCQICGYNEHPEILMVHHIKKKRRKKKENSFGAKHFGILRMNEELKKCLILCPNCHYWIHYEDNKFNYN